MRRPPLPRTRIAPASRPLLGLLVCLALGGATATAQAPRDEPLPDDALWYPLEGTRWRLTGYHLGDEPSGVAPEVVARLTLAAGRARAGVGCGPMRATYSLEEPPPPPEGPQDASGSSLPEVPGRTRPSPGATDSPEPEPPSIVPGDDRGEPLSFADIEPSDRPCPVPSAAVAEAMLEGLTGASSHTIQPGSEAWQAVLRVRDAGGQEVLTFRVDDASSLAMGQWLLTGWLLTDFGGDASGAAATTQAEPAVLSFDPRTQGRRSRGRLLGSTGCNSLSAEYTLEGSALSLRRLATSDLPCPAPNAAREAAILAVLGARSLLVELPPGGLRIHDPRSGDHLAYASERPLEGPTWLLTRLPGRELPDLTVTLRFSAGALDGEGPCGPYAGAYRTNGVLISVSTLRAASGACPRRRLERALLRALRDAVFVDARRPELRLQDEAGRVLARFRRPGAP